MILTKTTIDNSVKYIAQSEQTQRRDIKPNMMKNTSLPKKQIIKHSENKKKSLKIT